MSIRIYNGYKIQKDMPLYELMELLNEISKECQKICNDLYNKEVAKFIATCLDDKLVFGEDVMYKTIYAKYRYRPSKLANCLWMYIDELIEQHCKSEDRFQDVFDFKCELKLLPIEDKYLFMMYTQKKEYKDVFGYVDENGKEYQSEIFPEIIPYNFYNNVDYPEHLTKKDWDNRELDWEDALQYNEKGLMYDLIKVPYYYTASIIIKKIEDIYEERVNSLVNRKVKLNYCEKHNSDKDGVTYNFTEYLESNEYKEEVISIRKEIKKILPKTYTAEDLNNIKLNADLMNWD